MSSNYSPGVTGREPEIVGAMDVASQRRLIEEMNEEDQEILFGYLEARDDLSVYIEWAEDWQPNWDDRLVGLSGHTIEVALLGHSKEVAAKARAEAAKEHARMVREFAKGLPDKTELETLDVWASLERMAQAIEKGAK